MSLRNSCKWAGVLLGAILSTQMLAGHAEETTSTTSVRDVAEQELLRLSLEEGERKTRAAQQVAQAERLMKAGRYEEALELYRSATILDPSSQQAKDGKEQAQRYLVASPDVAGAAITRELERAQITQQDSLMKALNQLKEAERFLLQAETPTKETDPKARAASIIERMKSLDDADTSLSRASLGLAGTALGEDVSTEKRKALEMEARIKALRPGLQKELAELNRAVSALAVRSQTESIQDVSKKQHDTLMAEAQDHCNRQEYAMAEDILKQMLKENPADAKAYAMLQEAQQGLRENLETHTNDQASESRLRLMEMVERNAIASVSPQKRMIYPKDWDVLVESKRVGVSGTDTEDTDPESQEVLQKLEEPVSIEFEETNIRDALSFLKQRVNVNIMEKLSEEGQGKTVSLTLQNTRLENVLHWIMEQTGLNYEIRRGAIVVQDGQSVTGQPLTEVYDVRDIAFAVQDAKTMPDPDEEDDDDDDDDDDDEDTITLDQILKKVLAEDFTDERTNVEFDEGSGMLTVVQTPESHARIRKLLGRLRSAQAIQVAIEARFLNIRDDFWEVFETNWYDFNNQHSPSFYNSQNATMNDESYYRYNDVLYQGNFNNATQTLGSAAFLNRDQNADGFLDVNNQFDPGLYNKQLYGYVTNQALNGLQSTYGTNLGTGDAAATGGMLLHFKQQGWLSEIQSQFFLRMVKETSKADQLFAPHIVTYNNRYAWIQYTQRRPYIRSYRRASAGDGLEVERGWLRLGASLQVRPTVSADKKYITIEMHPKLTRLWPDENIITSVNATTGVRLVDVDTNNDGIMDTYAFQNITSPLDIPTVLYHETRTFATIPDGGSMILTGMGVNVDSKSRNGIPFLQDLPVIGNAFSSRGSQKEKRDFMIVLNSRMILLDEEEAKVK